MTGPLFVSRSGALRNGSLLPLSLPSGKTAAEPIRAYLLLASVQGALLAYHSRIAQQRALGELCPEAHERHRQAIRAIRAIRGWLLH